MSVPRFVLVRGRGRCRVLSIDGDVFTVLTSRDERLRVPRDRVTVLADGQGVA